MKKNKYSPGVYHLTTFDEYGTKLKTKLVKNGYFLKARGMSMKYLEKHPERSCIITRVLYNSKNPNNIVQEM